MVFDMELPKRKRTRLKEYDYSSPGMCFVTVCTDCRKQILSNIIVGQGLAPALHCQMLFARSNH